ncbi:MAG TPA: DUF86 domain-containing protein [Candidatus Rokubacteria bacterium]|nr:MAG: hypothetical protein A2X53_23160 [Candidatus Rokubacteria bacterium GWA2_70_23]HAM59797.1 DUF86 domain-containing protein [Candidatus Rokubacteria bacterium]
MVDREGLLEHLRALDEALRDWERYREKVSLRDLRSDRDARNMVLHAMLVAIQSAIDIASHLIAEHRLRRPETYRETFEILADAEILPRDLGEELADLAGFRNVLVHIYWRLDLEEVHRTLVEDLKSLQALRALMRRLLEGCS